MAVTLPVLDVVDVGEPRSLKRVRHLAPHARRFFFGERESAFLGRLVRDCPGPLVANRQFALPPFPITYVQVNLAAMLREVGRATTGGPNESEDNEAGFLVDGRRLRVLVRSSDGRTAVSPIEYDLGTPNRYDGDVTMAASLALALGGTLHDLADEAGELDSGLLATIAGENRVVPTLPGSMEYAPNAYGDLRNLWAALLVINRPRPWNVLERVAPRAVIHGGKRRVYMAHSVVRLDLDAVPRDLAKAMGLAERASPRRHGVRGHFVHYGLRPGCEHAWPPLAEAERKDDGKEILRWTCGRCGGRRTWRSDFSRGDATKGFSHATYEVGAAPPVR